MTDDVRAALRHAISRAETPAYVYFADEIHRRVRHVHEAFGGRFEISYAVKSNPNAGVLSTLAPLVHTLDASSSGELDRGLQAGYPGSRLTFSGPAKRDFELQRAVEIGCGLVVCESSDEIGRLNEFARDADRRVSVAIRINPRRAPRKFGVNMAGKPSQFGVDEEQLEAVAAERAGWSHVDLRGFHIYSGTNSLSEEAIAENFGIFVELFTQASDLFHIHPTTLIFGSGFGIPYHDDQAPLDVPLLATLVNPLVDRLRTIGRLRGATCVLEMGRYLVGPAGYFLTRVVARKHSRGTELCLCDGGFNNHLAAFGLMGTVIRRNWSMWNLSASLGSPRHRYTLVGPLCTTIDTLAQDVELQEVAVGDVIAVGASGAYGLTASPLNFISHPPPRELLVDSTAGGLSMDDVSDDTAASLKPR